MAKQSTNWLEEVLKTVWIGKTIYDDDDDALVIADLQYEPLTRSVIVSGTTGEELSWPLKKNFDMEVEKSKKNIRTKKRQRGKRDRDND